MLLIWTLSLLLGAVVGKKKYFCHAGRDLLLNTWKKVFNS